MASVLKAGVARVDITPPLGGSLAGYMADRASVRVHDPLQARCLALDNGSEKLAVAVCDLIAIGGNEVARARHLIHSHLGISPSHILICATHTHTAATPAPLFQSDPDPKYLEWLVQRISDGVRTAFANLAPARIGWGSGREPNMVFNRRFYLKPGTMPPNPFGELDRVKMNPGVQNPNILEPAGPVDPEVALLALQYADGAPLGLLGNYALHYVGAKGDDISADYFAMWCDAITRMIRVNEAPPAEDRPPFLAMLTNGCSGDINNVDVRKALRPPHPYHQTRRVAEVVAAEAYKAWQGIEYRDWALLAARETTLEFKIRKPAPAEVEQAKKILSQAGPELKGIEQIYARETVLLQEWPDTRRTLVQAMRIGDLGIVTFPGEAFVEMGLEIKAKSPFQQTLCIELANDYTGYLPTARHHDLGGYETWRARSSFLEKGAAERMVSEGLRMLNELAALPDSRPA